MPCLLIALSLSCARRQPDLPAQALAMYLNMSSPGYVYATDYTSWAKPMVQEEDLVAFRRAARERACYAGTHTLAGYPWKDVQSLAEKRVLQWEVSVTSGTISCWRPARGGEALTAWLHREDEDSSDLFESLPSAWFLDPSGIGSEWNDFLSVLRDMRFDSFVLSKTSWRTPEEIAEYMSREPEVMREVRKHYGMDLMAFNRPSYRHVAAGTGRDDKGAFLGLVWFYERVEDMKGDEDLIRKDHLKRAMLLREPLMNEVYDVAGASFERRGNVLFSRYYVRDRKPSRLWYLTLFKRWPYF